MTESAQVDLWNIESAATCGALITVRWDGREACLSLDAPETGLSAEARGRDLFDALQQLRRQLEPQGWYPLCNGARVDCYPSGMARDMGGARSIYALAIGQAGRPALVGLFEPAPPEKVATVADQDAFYQRWLASRSRYQRWLASRSRRGPRGAGGRSAEARPRDAPEEP